ncbi:MAG: hypothetical protein ACO1Q7_20500 [Gemmatimonas sp.]
MRRFQIRHVATALVLSAALPAAASAQLGKLRKAAADAGKEAAGVKKETPATAASGSNANVITTERLAAVVSVMEANMDRMAKEAAAKAAKNDYDTKRKAYDTCIEGQVKALANTPPSMAAMQNAGNMADRTNGLTQRMTSAQQNKKWTQYVATSDTLQIAAMQQTLTLYGVQSKCGAPVYMPPVLVADAAAKMDRQTSGGDSDGDQIVVPAAQRAGMTTYQFGMVRERAALWALQQTNNAPVGNSKHGVFTAEEQAVLEAQGAKLKKWAPIFKESPSTWVTWGDIKNW